MQVRTVALATLLLSGASTSRSQTVARQVESDVRNAAKDIVGVWIAPFRSTGRDWLIAGGAMAAAALVMPWDDDVDRWMVGNQSWSGWSAIRELREGGSAFTGKHVTPVLAVAYVAGLATNSRDVRDGVFGCLASYVSGSVLRNQLLYRVVARERPDSSRRHVVVAPPAAQGDQNDFDVPGGNWGEHSLPAGHVANIAACASFLNHRFSMGLAEPVLYALTASVGVGRMLDRRHWTSDTMLGVIFGYAIGKEVATRSLRRLENGRPPAPPIGTMRGVYLTPSRGGMTVGWRTEF